MTAVHIDRAADRRRSQLAAIHASAKQLQLDRETYEQLLQRVAGVRSAADLSSDQRRDVLREMKRLGATAPGRSATPGHHPGYPHNADRLPETITKIEAQLADMRLSWAYADAIAKRMFGIPKLAWVRDGKQLAAIVAALDVEQEKRALNARIDRYLTQLGWEPERLVDLLRPLRPNWRRHRASLHLVAKFLDEQVVKLDVAVGGID